MKRYDVVGTNGDLYTTVAGSYEDACQILVQAGIIKDIVDDRAEVVDRLKPLVGQTMHGHSLGEARARYLRRKAERKAMKTRTVWVGAKPVDDAEELKRREAERAEEAKTWGNNYGW